MGNYNPHLPQVLGQEWAPIRDEDFFLSPAVNSVEQGHVFTLAQSRTLQDGRFYLKTFPSALTLFQPMQISVYPKGLEDQTGPVHSVLIPCNNGGVTGNAAITLATTVAEALANPSDASYVQLSGGTPDSANADLYFATNAYAALLNGKRILSVEIVYTALSGNFDEDFEARAGVYQVPQTTGVDYGLSAGSGGAGRNEIVAPDVGAGRPEYSTLPLGEVSPWWSTTPMTQNEWLPWSYTTLQRFELSAANRITFRFATIQNPVGVLILGYVAMRVTYCEEKRVAISGQAFSFASNVVATTRTYTLGANAMPMRTIGTLALNPVLAPGEYETVLSAPDAGAAGQDSVPYPLLNSVRELYDIPPHPGVLVNVTKTEGETFDSELTHVLPQISLHASGGGPLTEVHAYGRQAVAQVYGTITAIQELYDATIPAATPFAHSRYYARRFGDTTVPLELVKVAGGDNISISPADFDALPEILDGWKEVSQRWDTNPTMGGGTIPQWQWIAPGETSGNRWEVLGATAPALSGMPGNWLNLVPSPNQLSVATYGAPVSGANVNLSWVPQYAPYVSATVDDQTSDAFLIFAQDMPLVTGFGVEVLNQAISGIGQNCGLNPCCIPTQIQYNRLHWGLPLNTGTALDTFDRVVASGGWGSADIGGPYTLVGTAADYSVDGEGLVTFSANNSSRFATLNIGAINFDITAPIAFQDQIASGTIRGGLVGRFTAANDNYLASLDVTTSGVVTIQIEKRVGGVATTLATAVAFDLVGGPGGVNNLRFMVSGSILKAKAWRYGNPEPDTWNLETTDTSLTTGNGAGIFARDNSAVTGHTVAFLSLTVTPPQYWFGYYELQRMDTVEVDWQTIMKATSVELTGFNDYEARAGILSSYRIRGVDLYGFEGLWSSTVSATIPSPGVTIGCTGGHLLIFTSNEVQNGSINLAYSSVWENQVEEGFTFAEASFVQLQAMYNRDFFTAFRPSERGGEQFQRTVLVQAAAIAPETLGDFTSLRDMAWANVSYICVRDEDGNRWLATIMVPSGRVLRDRRLYMAPVSIIEVTATPSPVDP